MTMLTGVNHVAVLTADLDRFVEFYRDVFELEVVFSETTPAFRHAILRAGEDSWIHPAEVAENAHGTALPAMFQRGHLDHVALGAASAEHFETLRDRLDRARRHRRRGRGSRRVPQHLVHRSRRHACRADPHRRPDVAGHPRPTSHGFVG